MGAVPEAKRPNTSKEGALVQFWSAVADLHSNRYSSVLERRVVHCFVQLASDHAHPAHIWDVLKRTGLLLVVVRALASKEKLRVLISNDGNFCDYMRSIQLVAEASPHNCLGLLLSPREVTKPLFTSFVRIIGELPLLDCEAPVYRLCCDSYVRTVSLLLSDARNCALLVSEQLSPIGVLFHMMNELITDRQDVALTILWVALQILLHTSNYTSHWVKEFDDLSDSTDWLFTVMDHCKAVRDSIYFFKGGRTIALDILCMLLSLSCSTGGQSETLYLHLKAAYNGIGCAEQHRQADAFVLGTRGVKIAVAAALLAMDHHDALFSFLAWILVRTVEANIDIVIAHCLVDESLVIILQQLVHSYEDNSVHGEPPISTIVRLCVAVHASPSIYAAHKAGAARLCLLLTELTSSSKEQIWVPTVQTMMDFRAISNVELLFTGLFAAELLERLNEKLATLCDQNGHNLMLEFMTEISMRVPSLRNKFLLVVNTLLNLIRSGARTDPQLLRRYIDLFTAICVNASAEVRHVYSDLQDRLTCGSFHDVDSIVSGCWILQTCARVVNESCGARTYFTVHSHGLLSCLERLCLNMRSTFEARQMSRSTSRGGECARVSCPSVVEEVGNEMLLSDDGTTEEARVDSQIYSSQCRFFTIKLHLLCILHSNCSETSARAISSGLMYAVSKGPFLDCPVFTSVVARTFIGLCSVSSRAVFETLPGECQGNATDGSLLERDLHFDMMLQDSYGDGLFYRGIQRIVHAGSLGDLYTVIRGSAKNAPRALFATSIVELVLNVYSKRVENLYTLAESGVLRMLAELLAIVVAEDQKHLPHCREKIIGAIKMLGKYGVDHSSVLFSLALCLDTHADGSVSYDPESTVALLRLWKALLNQSSPSSEPVSFCALSASSPCSTQPGACIGDHSMERLGLTTGMDLPVDYRLQKQDRGVSCISWLLLEENHRPTTEACDVVLLSLWMDNYDNALQLLVGGDGVLRLQLAVAVSKSQQQLVVPISPPAPGTRIPMGQWCMISVACSTSTSGAATRTSRNSLAVRISLQFGSTRVEVPWVQVVPADIKSPTLAAHGADLLRMVNKISVSTSQDNHAGIQPRFLMGALAFFGDVLTAVEERLLFSMGSDNLLSLSMLDKVFITDLSLTLELLGATNGEMLTSDFPHLTLLRLTRAPPNQDRCWRVNSAAFSPYQNSKKLALVAGGFRGALRVMSNRGCTAACTNSPKRQTTVPASDRFSSSDSLRNVSVDSTSTSIRSTPTSAALKDTGNAQGEVLAAVNKPQFFHVSPLYSILDALGGVSFFLWLAVLQAPRSAAFYEAWECFCLVLQRHTLWGFSSTVPRFGEQHLCTLLRGMLGTRIPVCEKVASSFCEVVGRRSILRPDLLGLLLDFTLWSEDAGAFRVVLHHLRDYLLDDHYSCFNRKVLEHCASGWCDRKRRSALDEFLLHLYVHFQHSTTGEWGSATLSYGTAYLGALCRTVSDMKTILQAVKVFVVIEKDPVASAVKWATELLGIVHCMARQLDCLHVKGSASLGDDVVVLFKCPDESVRRAALHVLPYVPLTKKQEDAIVNAYLRRSDTFPSGRILSSEEFDTMVELALEAAHSEDSAMGRILLHLLIVLCAHLSETEHTRVVALLTEVVSRRWPFTGGSLPFTEPKDRISVHVQQSLLGLLPGLSLKEPSFMNSLLELLKHMSAGMVEASWETCGASCGYLVGETALAILLSNPSVLKYFEEKSGLDANVESTLCNTYHYIAHVLRVFDTLLSKGSCTKSFLEDYVSFLKATATTIILLSQCETEFKGKEESNFECDTLSTRTLMHMYLTVFGKPLTFGGNRVSLRLFLLFSEASQRLLIHLQTGDLLLPLTRYFTRVPEDLLKLQWRVVFSLLYSADKTDDTLVKEVMLLHLTGTGYSILGLSLPLQQKRMPCVEPPAGSNWKHIRLQPGSLILEMLRVTDGTAFGDSAPWILILKAASHLLSSVGQESQNRLDMAINVCRLVRYSGSIWSLVKSYVSPSSVQGSEEAIMMNRVESESGNEGTLSSRGDSGYLRDVELLRCGVTVVEKYSGAVHASAHSLLKRCSVRISHAFQANSCKPMCSADLSGSDDSHLHTLLNKCTVLYRQYVDEECSAVVAAHAAYRFSLLPWWNHCANLHAGTPLPLNRWELDRALGPEWQRIRLCRFISDPRATRDGSTDQLLPVICRGAIAPVDDVALIKFYTVSSVPQVVAKQVNTVEPFTTRCQLVLPMRRVPITLSVSHFSVSYVLAASDDDTLSIERKKATIPFGRVSGVYGDLQCLRRVFAISSIRAVLTRRNLLQPCALELLFATGDSLFLAFDSEDDSVQAYKVVEAIARPYLDKKLSFTEEYLKLWRTWWCEGRVSNFHYLMYLNFAAGRSYGDLRQYPIFPHVLADFSSETVDLSSPNTFRCLSKPMGAQTPESAQRAVTKYNEMLTTGCVGNGVVGSTPYHYGSHYAPLGGVLHFLVRIQPFSDYFLAMNSGFDDAGRVFDSLAKAFTISSSGKDVKELLPEFYCLPEMFTNLNRIQFGLKQDGSVVDDVQLPPWASTPRELSRTLREGLESQYVSENLHSWIDLIFGYKQRGKEAIASLNVFFPLTYEGAVDLSSVTDPMLRSGWISQIDFYGQTPWKLFSSPHKARGKPTGPVPIQNPCPTLQYGEHTAALSVILFPTQLAPAGVLKSHIGSRVVFPSLRSVHSNVPLASRCDWKLTPTQTRPVPLKDGVLPFTVVHDQIRDCIFHRGNCLVLVDGRTMMQEMCSFNVGYGEIAVLAVDAPNVYVGMESGSIRCFSIVNVELDEVEVSASRKKKDKSGLVDVIESIQKCPPMPARSRQYICQQLCVFYGHTARIIALSVSPEWNALVSSAEDYTLAVWDVERRVPIRTIPFFSFPTRYSHFPPVSHWVSNRCKNGMLWLDDLIEINVKSGDIIVAGKSHNNEHAVRLYTMNGTFVDSYALGNSPARALLSVGSVVFVAKEKSIHVLREHNLEWLCDITHPCFEDSIVSLALNSTGTLLSASDLRGNIVSWKVAL